MYENDENDERNLVRSEYVYTGFKCLADLKLRFGKWLEEERGW